MLEGTQVRLVVPVQGAQQDPIPALQVLISALNAAVALTLQPLQARPVCRARAASTNHLKAKRRV